ncbi:hypothetical protein BH11BAC4_BH11BAC4_23140 [soil metagenome]
MQFTISHISLINKLRVLFCVVLLEWLLFIFSGVSFSFLHGNQFFSLEVDPVSWFFYLLHIPQFIITHQWISVSLDILIVLLLLLFIRNPFINQIAILLFILLLIFYITLMSHLIHRNYQFGFFLVFIPFFFHKEINRKYAFTATRYFLLFFYVSAAFLKLTNGALSDPAHFSHLASGQFTPYFLEGNTGLRTSVNLYLVSHHAFGYMLFIISVILEFVTVVGFFSRRFDKWIALFLLLFHFANWFLMDIAPIGQIAFISLLFLSREPGLKEIKT